MKAIFGCLITLAACLESVAFAFEESYFTVPSANILEEKTSVAGISHGFSTKIIDADGLVKNLDQKNFGLSSASVGGSFRYNFIQGLDAHVFTGWRAPEVNLGAGYTLPLNNLLPYAGIDAVLQHDRGAYRKSFFVFAGAQTLALAAYHVIPSLAVAYDSYDKNPGLGLAVAVPFSEDHAILAELVAHFNNEPLNFSLGEFPAFSAGYRYTTPAHQFFFMIANTDATTFKQALLGSATTGINFSFKITRLF